MEESNEMEEESAETEKFKVLGIYSDARCTIYAQQ
jgi:hypothetical protein